MKSNSSLLILFIGLTFSNVIIAKTTEPLKPNLKNKVQVGEKPSTNKSNAKMNHNDHKGHDHSDQKATLVKVGPERLIIKVKGMVCAFCAQGIKKNFNKQEQVKQTTVNLDTMEVTVELKSGKTLSEKVIRRIVTDAGFAYAGIKK